MKKGMPKLTICGVLCVLLLAGGCGRKGNLLPPDAIAPPPVTDLRVVQKGDLFELIWSSPARMKSAVAGQKPALFRILRREVLPEGEDCPSCPYRQIGEIDLEYPGAAMRRGEAYVFRDTSVVSGTTYQYTVVPVNGDGVSGNGSSAIRKKKLTPPPPSPLKAETTESDLLLSWGFEPLPDSALLIGYNVYRKNGDRPFVRLNRDPIADFRYRDQTVRPGIEYHYVVRAVSDLEGQVFEGGPSNEAGGRIPEP